MPPVLALKKKLKLYLKLHRKQEHKAVGDCQDSELGKVQDRLLALGST